MHKIAALLFAVILTASFVMVANAVSYSTRSRWNTWGSKTPMPTSRVHLGAAVVKGKIYAIGGGSSVNVNEMYDPTTDNWTTKAPMPTPRKSFGTAAYKNKIYAIGGLSDQTDSYSGITGANEVYDPETDTWKNKTALPTIRYAMDANVVEDKIYVIGGKNASGWIDGVNEVYDPATDTWTTKAPMPTRVSYYASAVCYNKIYVFGGYNGSDYVDLTQIYDPDIDTWSNGAPIPYILMYGAGAGATTGVWAPKRICVLGAYPPFGGINEGVFFVDGVHNQIYDPERDAWSSGARLPLARIGCGVAVADDILYAIGGTNSLFFPYSYSDNQCYTPNEYGTIPPVVSVFSPETMNYTSSNVSLDFTVNKPASWMGYSLDGQDNVTVTGNTTLSGLTSGSHAITVYAKDAFENTSASKTISFTIAEPFPTALVAIAAVAVVVAGTVGVLIYFKKCRH
jgi:N-acetylneuraminic acid mutarotase